MKWIVDAQLPPGSGRGVAGGWLRRGGRPGDRTREAKDAAIWQYALQNNAAILTKDEVWLRIGNATNPVLLGWFLPMLPVVAARITSGDRLIEVR